LAPPAYSRYAAVMIEQGRNCWRVERAERLAVIVDAEDYFAAAREAFLGARRRIMLIGWDFDARIRLSGDEREEDEPETLGAFLLWLVDRRPELEIYLLRWDVGALRTAFRGATIFTMLRWMRHPRIHLKLDGHHPTGASHHQKIVSVDDCLAFCGGIDMTVDRWDTREHRDHDPRRKLPSGKLHKPWHDATTALSGPIAKALAEECRARWMRASGQEVGPLDIDAPCWPDNVSATVEDVQIALARTHPEMPDQQSVHEIEAMFLDQIAMAKRFIYCESQYFASRRIAEAIGKRLDEEQPPEIVIVNPVSAQGWLEPIAMDTARARLMGALRKRDRKQRLRMYHPHTAGGAAIYVHAKITTVDDQQIRIGSANLNNRSMRLDTECDVLLDAARNGDHVQEIVVGIRNGLLAEHLGVSRDQVESVLDETGSLIETIERLRGSGRSLRPYEIPDVDAVEAWLADNEVLDPEGPGEMFEAFSKRGLFRRWRR
jgi:phosphatidylserine/phosphatidylglycerophosphate/cardiolipin synthase-like enzyme